MKISVIVLSYNRAAHLKNCLEALSNCFLHYQDMEVIVADAGSTENNCDVALAQERLPLVVLRHDHKYTGDKADAAFGVHQCAKTANMGIKQATGDVIQFLQHDHILSPLYLYHLAQFYIHMPKPLNAAIIVGYCHYLENDVGPEFVDWLAEADTFGIPPTTGKPGSSWQPYPRYERFFGRGMQTLLRCPDWRGIDGFDCAVRRDHCLLLDEEFEGQGFEHMDWVYRQVTQAGSLFWCSPLLQHYHQPHQEVRKEAQWQSEMEIARELFSKKHGEEAWRQQIG